MEAEVVEITQLELDVDEAGAVTAATVTGEVRVEPHHPGLPPDRIDAVADVVGALDREAGELSLNVIDEQGNLRMEFVLLLEE